MRVGLFTDTYFPQVSGVATSIRTLKTELEKLGHTVFIFTTTDKDVNRYEDWQIIRIPSVPFFAFKDRRVAYRGFSKALAIAKQYQLDIIHTQTEFSLGLLGVWIGRELRIPVIHTYHTQYEDYVRYIARGMVIRPSMVKYIVRSYMNDLDGVICSKNTRSRQKNALFRQGLIWPSLTDRKSLRQRQLLFVKNMKSKKMKRFY